MTAKPAAFCETCGTYLSPAGTRKAAEEARTAHESNRLTFEGIQHTIVIKE